MPDTTIPEVIEVVEIAGISIAGPTGPPGVGVPAGGTVGQQIVMASSGTTAWQSKVSLDVRDYGAVGDGTTDNRAAFQACIDAVVAVGGGVVTVPSGTYAFTSVHPTSVYTLPGDDGTLSGGSTIAAEPVQTMPVVLDIPSYVQIVGASRHTVTLKGSWDGATVGLTQPALLYYSASTAYENHLRSLTVTNVFIGAAGSFTRGQNTGSWALTEFADLGFDHCAFPMISSKLERCRFRSIQMTACWAGLVNGGWWIARTNTPQEEGWVDKSIAEDITWTSAPFQDGTGAHLTQLDAIDTFYDTYFFKTANNATRAGPPSPNDYITSSPFKGVCGIAVNWMSRYGRGSLGSTIRRVFSYSGIRAGVQVAWPSGGYVGELFIEAFGWVNSQTFAGVWGVDRVDPWQTGKSIALIYLPPLVINNTRPDIGTVTPVKCNAQFVVRVISSTRQHWAGITANQGGVGVIDNPQTGAQFGGTLMASGGFTILNSSAVTVHSVDVATGDWTFTDAVNVVLGTTTGTKIGTASAQKIGFYGAAPVAKPTGVTTRQAVTNLGLVASPTDLQTIQVTQAAYDALGTKDATTLYVIIG